MVHLTQVYQKPQSYEIRSERQVFVILGHFVPFRPLATKKIKIKKKMKKASGDVITLHVHKKSQSFDVS